MDLFAERSVARSVQLKVRLTPAESEWLDRVVVECNGDVVGVIGRYATRPDAVRRILRDWWSRQSGVRVRDMTMLALRSK